MAFPQLVLIPLVEQAQVIDDLLALTEILLCFLLALLSLACLFMLGLKDSTRRGSLSLWVFFLIGALVPPVDVFPVFWVDPAVGCFIFRGRVPLVDDRQEGGLLMQKGRWLVLILVLVELILILIIIGLCLVARLLDIFILVSLLIFLLVFLLLLDHLSVDLLLHALLHALHELLADPVHFIYNYMLQIKPSKD